LVLRFHKNVFVAIFIKLAIVKVDFISQKNFKHLTKNSEFICQISLIFKNCVGVVVVVFVVIVFVVVAVVVVVVVVVENFYCTHCKSWFHKKKFQKFN